MKNYPENCYCSLRDSFTLQFFGIVQNTGLKRLIYNNYVLEYKISFCLGMGRYTLIPIV